MSQSANIAAIQLNSSQKVEENLRSITQILASHNTQALDLVVLPEMFCSIDNPGESLQIAEEYENGPIQDYIRELAREHNCWIVAGTIPLKCHSAKHATASCLVFNHNGEIVSRYDKIHLCDINLNARACQCESDHTLAGEKPIVVDTPFAKIGLAVCYDIRFPELFRCLSQHGAEIIAVPAAFLHETGQHHWEILLRARAIENSCYVIAANQTGKHSVDRHSYGNSMIINHWGEILSNIKDKPGLIQHRINLTDLHDTREKAPFLQHQKIAFNP